ncbi:hypothetical protein GQ43DRAFT_441090 [Delitschia confertaspora ATCC 74209]|uniref:Membrane insertase YidC/Oxa/ALB C-terminal domain-containing protein n=1 Tax=Delitschia confertaspora ATCC 74209 TaxID=1513339 RepID=A0A9P4MYI3_9PLEO|nr:hypothetical protein GQ43DRAFT_441090 [Delitschia confertaspora ATCC 74209]
MLPSRGLKPALFAPTFQTQSLSFCSNASRKFSTVPRRTAVSSQCRTHGLHPSGWKAGSTNGPAPFSSTIAIRNASWWSSGSSKSFEESNSATQSTPAAPQPPPPEPVVITKTPELSPETLNSPAVTETPVSASSSSWYNPLSWGSKPAEAPAVDAVASSPAPAPQAPSTPEAPVTTATPELAPKHVETTVSTDTPAETVDGVLESALDPSLIPERIGYLKEMGLDFGWGPTAFNEWLIEHAHISLGLPWLGSIVAVTVLARVAIFPLMVQMSDNAARLETVAPVTTPLTQKYTQAMQSGDRPAMDAAQKQIRAIKQKAGIVGWKSFAGPLGQAVLGFGMFRLLRNMSDLPVPGMKDAGVLWFTDLTISDPYYLLPLVIGYTLHLTMKKGGEAANQTQFTPFMKMFMSSVVPVVMALFACWLPASLQISFLTSNIIGFGSQTIFRSNKLRQMIGLYPTPTPEVKELLARVQKGEITHQQALDIINKALSDTRSAASPAVAAAANAGAEVGVQYEAPTLQSLLPKDAVSKINIRPGAPIPAHLMRKSNATTDPFDEPIPEDFKGKMQWFAKNFRPSALGQRLQSWFAEKMGKPANQKLAEKRKEQAKKKAEEYEFRRKEALKANKGR